MTIYNAVGYALLSLHALVSGFLAPPALGRQIDHARVQHDRDLR
jgi:hypothetical protein